MESSGNLAQRPPVKGTRVWDRPNYNMHCHHVCIEGCDGVWKKGRSQLPCCIAEDGVEQTPGDDATS